MAFAKQTDEAEEGEALREALETELADMDLSDEDIAAPTPAAVVAEETLFEVRPRSSARSRTVVKLIIGVAAIAGAIWALNRWATPPAIEPLAELDIKLDGAGYWIAGEQISSLVDGAPVFFEAAGFADRGAVPGSTKILLDVFDAPGSTGERFRGELEARGFTVERASAPVVVEFSTRQAVEE